MIFASLKMTNFCLNMTNFLLNITNFCLNMTNFLLNITNFCLNMTNFLLTDTSNAGKFAFPQMKESSDQGKAMFSRNIESNFQKEASCFQKMNGYLAALTFNQSGRRRFNLLEIRSGNRKAPNAARKLPLHERAVKHRSDPFYAGGKNLSSRWRAPRVWSCSPPSFSSSTS
jgi:hypothetical protein